MASGKRASMREGPLAHSSQTEGPEPDAKREEAPRRDEASRRASRAPARPCNETHPRPPAVPEQQDQEEHTDFENAPPGRSAAEARARGARTSGSERG